MTSQKDQIQSLIADIEQVLGSTKPRTAWVRASDTERQRQVLAKAQDYLMSLQQAFDAPGGWGPVDPSTGQVAGLEEDTGSSGASPRASRGIAGIFSSLSTKQTDRAGTRETAGQTDSQSDEQTALQTFDPSDPTDASERSAEDVLQALLTEMKFLRSSALEPLRLEMNSLREQRDRLRQEVTRLDEERSTLSRSEEQSEVSQLEVTEERSAAGAAVSEEQLNQFLAVLMERLQERLSTQVTQTLAQLESDHAAAVSRLSAVTDAEVLQLRPSGQGDQLEEMRQLQSRSDQLLVNIESTLQGMYETLQKNIDSYQYSLNEGIENMHSLGRQGEVIVRSLVDHLTQQLGQTAPPEPAFYPPRLAAPTAPTATEPTDTVASLDDILPENCIQEDGTIDLDLLKLDIDRSDEDDELTVDDLTVDTAMADAQVAATEAEDAEIEAKVTPTADAAYLADLTIDDLTADTNDEPLFETPSFSDSGLDSDVNSASKPALSFQPADETELADILPNFGESAEESTEEFTEAPNEQADDGAAAEPDSLSEDAVSEDSLSEDAVSEESMTAILAAALGGTSAVEAESAIAADVDIPESALVPDIPETEEEISNGLNTSPDVSAVSGDEIRSDDEVSSALAAELEASNQAADQVVEDSVRGGLDTLSPDLASDLEEATVSEADAPLPEVLTSNIQPLESSLIPDLPEAFAVEASVEEVSVEEASAKEASTEEVLTAETPTAGSRVVEPPLAADMDIPESAIVPDIPETEDEISNDLGASLDVSAVTEDEIRSDEIRSDEIRSDEIRSDDEVSSALAAELEANSQAADRVVEESVRGGLDVLSPDLASDLEEATVSEAVAPLPEVLTSDTQPLESSLAPDLPGPSTEEAFEEEAFTAETHTSGSVAVEPPFAADSTDQDSAPDPLEESSLNLEESMEEMSSATDSADESTDLLDRAIDLSTDDLLDNPPTDLPLEFLPEAELEATPSSVDESVNEADEVGEVDEVEEVEEPSTETAVESPASAAFNDDLDSYRDQDSLADPVDEYLESLSTELSDLPVAAPPLPYISSEGSEEPELEEGKGDKESYADPSDPQPSAWFLGIDIGTTGLSAVLINQLGDQVYPLCWNTSGDPEANRFRLPAVLQVSAQTGATGAVGMAALRQSDRLLRNIKPLLKVGIPHSTSEPLIQWSDRQRLPLLSLQVALTDLLRDLSVTQRANQRASQMGCQAIGLENRALRWALSNLKGVIVGYPNNWPDTYSFNIREAVLAAGIVAEPGQVYFVEEVIAALLSALPDPKAATEDLDAQQPGLYNCNWEGGTVVISAGATLTEAAIADLPKELDQLIYRDFALRSFTYAGDSLDQDIVCQLLHLPAQARLEASSTETSPSDGWQSLGLDRLNLPHAGEADRAKRHRLRQRLNDSTLGHEAITAARKIKLALQEEPQCEITLADQSWVVKRKDLETKVFLPYIQRVNRQVNGLLSQKGLSAQAVKQVVCTGGTASLEAIARWLRQKFPNATIIQDTYSGEYSNSCSRVAYGLANLCRYPHVLDTHRHQYSDYFLLLELLRILPDQPLPAGGILHLLEQRGINTQACQSHILALIEGHLPPGLIPTEGDRPMISAQSPDIGTYQMLAELPLFRKQGGQIYIADQQQGERLRHYLEALLATKAQKLQEPLPAELTAAVVS